MTKNCYIKHNCIQRSFENCQCDFGQQVPHGNCRLIYTTVQLITHTDDSRMSKAFSGICVSVCPHYKIKMAETKITKLATGIVHHESLPNN